MNWQKTTKHELPGGQVIQTHPVSVMGHDGRWHPHVTMSAEDWATVQAALEDARGGAQ